MNTPHKYADILRAIADGKPIQFKSACECGRWIDADVGEGYPNFKSGAQWRVKPEDDGAQTMAKRLAKAERTLLTAGYTDNGGELWKPPLGKHPGAVLLYQTPYGSLAGCEKAVKWIGKHEIAIAKAASEATYNASHDGRRRAFCDLELDLYAIIASVK